MRVNLIPTFWGPCAWHFLDSVATGMDKESMPYFEQLVGLLPFILPCASCRTHTTQYLATHPITTDNPRQWLQDFQTYVRDSKPQGDKKVKFNEVTVLVGLIVISLMLLLIKNAFF
jgi:hypothetical protein